MDFERKSEQITKNNNENGSKFTSFNKYILINYGIISPKTLKKLEKIEFCNGQTDSVITDGFVL